MKTFFISLLLLAGCSGSPSREIAQVDNQIREVLELHDQSEDRMPSSSLQFRGQKVENRQSRTLSLLSPEEKRIFGIDEDHLAFANFRHMNQFYIAEVLGMTVKPDNSIKNSYNVVQSVSFQKEHWSPVDPRTSELEAHSLLRFTLARSSGLRLVYNQSSKQYVSTSIPVLREIVVSWEAIRSANKPDAAFVPSALGLEFASAYLVYSAPERARLLSTQPKTRLVTHRLNLGRSRSNVAGLTPLDALLWTGIKSSQQWGRNQTYNILLNNCTARAFDILDVATRPAGAINFGVIQQRAVDLASNESKQMAQFMIDTARSKRVALPREVDAALVQIASGVLLKKAQDLNFNRMNNPRGFFYEAPVFVEAHLRARGLIP